MLGISSSKHEVSQQVMQGVTVVQQVAADPVKPTATSSRSTLAAAVRNSLIGGAVGGALGGVSLLAKTRIPGLGMARGLAGIARFGGIGLGIGAATAFYPSVKPFLDRNPGIKAAVHGAGVGAAAGVLLPLVSPALGAIAGGAIGLGIHALRNFDHAPGQHWNHHWNSGGYQPWYPGGNSGVVPPWLGGYRPMQPAVGYIPHAGMSMYGMMPWGVGAGQLMPGTMLLGQQATAVSAAPTRPRRSAHAAQPARRRTAAQKRAAAAKLAASREAAAQRAAAAAQAAQAARMGQPGPGGMLAPASYLPASMTGMLPFPGGSPFAAGAAFSQSIPGLMATPGIGLPGPLPGTQPAPAPQLTGLA